MATARALMLNNIVFLSHSSKTPAALADVDQLRVTLEQAGFRVRLDFRTIQGGEDWNAEIDHWMSECGAAVLLLSPDALLSDWVFTEARILQWRKRFDSQLTLVPVVISGTTKKDFLDSERHKLLKLDPLQILEEVNAAQSAPRVRAALGTPVPAAPSELQQVANTIAAPLSRMAELDFENVFIRLDMELPPWRPNSQHSKTLARALAWRFLTMNVHKVDLIVDALGGAISAKDKDAICRQISAFWVRAETAKLLSDAAQRQPGRGAVALNGVYLVQFTADAYVRRALWPKERWRIIPVEGGAGTDPLRHIEESILQGASRMSPRDPEGFLRDTQLDILVLLPDRDLVDCQGLDQLRKRFPRATFILGTGKTLPDLTAEGYTELTHLQPALDLRDEFEAHRAFNDAMALLSGS